MSPYRHAAPVPVAEQAKFVVVERRNGVVVSTGYSDTGLALGAIEGNELEPLSAVLRETKRMWPRSTKVTPAFIAKLRGRVEAVERASDSGPQLPHKRWRGL